MNPVPASPTRVMSATTGQTVEVAYVDQGDTGPAAREAANKHGIALVVVKLAQAERCLELLPRRWVVERS